MITSWHWKSQEIQLTKTTRRPDYGLVSRNQQISPDQTIDLVLRGTIQTIVFLVQVPALALAAGLVALTLAPKKGWNSPRLLIQHQWFSNDRTYIKKEKFIVKQFMDNDEIKLMLQAVAANDSSKITATRACIHQRCTTSMSAAAPTRTKELTWMLPLMKNTHTFKEADMLSTEAPFLMKHLDKHADEKETLYNTIKHHRLTHDM